MLWIIARFGALIASIIIFLFLLLLSFSNEEILGNILSYFLSLSSYFSAYEGLILSYSLSIAVVISALFSFFLYQALVDIFLSEKTEREGTEELFISREEFKELYDYSPLPYLVLDKKGTITKPNNAALRLFEKERAGLEGTNLMDIVAPENKDRTTEIIERFRRSISVRNEEIEIIRPNGVRRWVMLSIFSSRVPGKERQGFAAFVDITEQKEIDKAKSEFVSLASHQLRTPLTSLSWYTESLLSQDVNNLTEKQRGYIEKIRNRNQDMIELVETLLNISRIEMGTLAITSEKTDVSEIIKGITEELEPDIHTKEMELRVEYGPSPLLISTDPKLLRIVIQNLMTNAIKYTPEKGSVKISARDTGRDLEIVVSDTGYGIPPEAQDKLFTKMFRADNIRTKEVKGTGLGLYMTKSFVEMMGGKISFVSELDKGTTFTVTLPK